MNLFQHAVAKERFSAPLHGMRGIAAVVILCCHIGNRVRVFSYGDGSYDGVPFNSVGAITFFFVLSGLVLAASLSKSALTPGGYASFMTRRAIRIMPLMFVTVTFGGFYLVYIDPHMRVPSLPEGYNNLTPAKFLSAYIGYSLKPNPPIWTIFIEFLGCALLPFMVAAGRGKGLVILSGAALLLFSCFQFGLQNDWNIYMIDFFVGVTILWWGRPFSERAMRLNKGLFWLLFAVLFAVFYLPRELWNGDWHDPRFNLMETAAIAPIIAIAYYCPQRLAGLATRPFRFLGSVAFSLYLTHWFVVMGAINFLAAAAPSLSNQPSAAAVATVMVVMIALTLPVCLVLADLAHLYIEEPGRAFGRNAAAFLRHRVGGPRRPSFAGDKVSAEGQRSFVRRPSRG